MIAYKGFSKELTARLGKGIFQYEIGQTYTEESAKCANTGFHCVEEPIRVLSWYGNSEDRYCQVEVDKDIHEDGQDRISASRIHIVKELNRVQLATLECRWLIEHPKRKYSPWVQEKKTAINGIAIARGKKPQVEGEIGDYLFLLQEYANRPDIKRFEVYIVDGEKIKENTYIDISGKAVKSDTKR